MKNALKYIIGLFAVFLTLTTMAHFEPAYDKTGGHEGGHVFVESDMGMETINGISRKYHPDAKVWRYVDTVARELGIDNSKPVDPSDSKMLDRKLKKLPQVEQAVREFYKRNYWDELLLDPLESQAVAEELYDTAVNQGTGQAGKYLQRSLNFLNRNGRSYPDIKVDGVVGQITLGTLENYMKAYRRYGADFAERTLVKALDGEQYMRYRAIVLSRPDQEVNFAGWLRRIGSA